MKTIEFTENELQILTQLLDIAVKAGGLNVAEAAVVLARKVSAVDQQPVEPFFAEPTLVPEEDSSEEDSPEEDSE